MEKQRFTTKSIALMGELIGLRIVLSQFLSITTPFVKISFFFIPVVIMAIMFGPVLTGAGNAIGDFIGALLFPAGGAYFPGFTLTALIAGLIYGASYHKKELTLKRIIITNIIVTFLVSFPLNTLWLYMIFSSSVVAMIPTRLIASLILCAVQIAVTYSLANVSVFQKQVIKFIA